MFFVEAFLAHLNEVASHRFQALSTQQAEQQLVVVLADHVHLLALLHQKIFAVCFLGRLGWTKVAGKMVRVEGKFSHAQVHVFDRLLTSVAAYCVPLCLLLFLLQVDVLLDFHLNLFLPPFFLDAF